MMILRTLISDLLKGRHIETYITILLGVVVSVLGIFSVVRLEILLSMTTALLALLAWGLLESKKQTELLQSKIEQIPITTALYREKNAIGKITQMLEKAQREVCVLARYGTTLQSQRALLERLLSKGCRVRIVICSSNDNLISLLAKRGYSTTQSSDIKAQIDTARGALVKLSVKYSAQQELFELREINYLPSLSIYLIDPELEENGEVFAQIGTFQTSTHNSLSIATSSEDRKEVYDFFIEQFENYWNAAEPIEFISIEQRS